MPRNKEKGRVAEIVDVSPRDDDVDSHWSSDEGEDRTFRVRSAVPKDGKSHLLLLDTLIKHGVAVKGNVSSDGKVAFEFRTSVQNAPKKEVTNPPTSVGSVPYGPPPAYYDFQLPIKKDRKHRHKHRRSLFF